MQPITRAQFGRTGNFSSRLILGGNVLKRASREECREIGQLALAYGVNHVDTAARYGSSESRLGDWLQEGQGSGREKALFVSTKTEARSARACWDGIEQSLLRIGTGQVDLFQLHDLVEAGAWEQAFNAGGAVEALVSAQKEGLVRFVGVTGHGRAAPRTHLQSLRRFRFDSVMVPLSPILVEDGDYRRDIDSLLSVCEAEEVAVQAIKTFAKNPCPPPGDLPRTWYTPLSDPAAIKKVLAFAFGYGDVFVVSSGDREILEPTLRAAAELSKSGAPPKTGHVGVSSLDEMVPTFGPQA